MPESKTGSTPAAYAPLVGATPALVVGANPSRVCLVFYNPGPNQVAICPVNPPGMPTITPAVRGGGCITLSMDGTAIFDTLVCTAAWQAVASAPNSPLTIYEA